jgi:hypothetical protein
MTGANSLDHVYISAASVISAVQLLFTETRTTDRPESTKKGKCEGQLDRVSVSVTSAFSVVRTLWCCQAFSASAWLRGEWPLPLPTVTCSILA